MKVLRTSPCLAFTDNVNAEHRAFWKCFVRTLTHGDDLWVITD